MPNDTLQPRESLIEKGEVAPDFTLPDQDRNDWRLSDAVKAGNVVLCFYPLAFTGVCTDEMVCVTNEMAKAEQADATVVGISCDSFAANKAWSEQAGIRQPLLADMHRQVCKAYGLYWDELNVSGRGTVIIGQDDSGVGKVTWAERREPGSAMDFEAVMRQV